MIAPESVSSSSMLQSEKMSVNNLDNYETSMMAYPSSELSSESVSPSSPSMTNLWGGFEEPKECPTSLLDLDFSEDVDAQPSTSLFLTAPFEEVPSRVDEPEVATGSSPFVQDHHDSVVSPALINPQVLSAPPMPAITEEVFVKAEEVAQEESATPMNESHTTFTTFSPERLDDSDSSSIKPLLSISTYSKESQKDVDDLRPSLEEYNKLSSKEKRQLRNKISARNFRNRRKEYIHLLEEQVTERDALIKNLQDQLSSLRLENSQLQDELRAHRTRTPSTVDVSKLLTALQRTSQGASDANTRSPQLTVPNTRKDVSAASRPSSPSLFWSGVNAGANRTTVMV
ncbi:bzip transcription factor [Malassezia pachydermatis]|uniref:Bzip transcription factor n=1 Tax=Malassezia pachydermatis TaxID=77020 RepID=A0A0M8MM60_9BASI|nr:bzip transcription factor [Malassezia pachydermatis]KOS12917.1 bzip transcription factor [Malassezia pachydermatis]